MVNDNATQMKRNNTASSCTFCRILTGITIFILIAAAAGTYVYGSVGRGKSTLNIPDIEETLRFFDGPDDRFGGDATEPWRVPKKEGLRLTVVNALSKEYHPFFYKAVDDWDNGKPDALTLTTATDIPDPECSFMAGKMKVCNSDYGATDWEGRNTIKLRGGFIIASIARINDYYIRDASAAKKQYIMCHELGHGFGIADADFNHFNLNLGTCMDYTNRPRTNQRPNQHNYEILESLYGRVPGNRSLAEERREERIGDVPAYSLKYNSYNKTYLRPSSSKLSHQPQWRLLEKIGEDAEVHELDLGKGITLREYVVLH